MIISGTNQNLEAASQDLTATKTKLDTVSKHLKSKLYLIKNSKLKYIEHGLDNFCCDFQIQLKIWNLLKWN